MRAKPYRTKRTDPTVEAAATHERGREHLLPVLQAVQQAEGYLPCPVLGAVADKLRLSDAETYGVATFYSMLSTEPQSANVLRLCDGPVCELKGASQLKGGLKAAVARHGYVLTRTSCLGLCDRAPAALLNLEPCGPILPSNAEMLFDGWRGTAPCYHQPRTGEVRVALARLGRIDCHQIGTAIGAGAYRALETALSMPPADVLQIVSDSGLQGRGGAGFPTGRKWQAVAAASAEPKYIVCNADESEPAAFKDRVLLEEDPHLLLEGMALAGYAVGATTGYIYIRGEYEEAARRLERAIDQAEQYGWLGDAIQGSDFSFQIHLHRGAGAYICGEETALLESLEGRRGEPRLRPPFPTTHGLYGQPTVVNNVETFCKAPPILLRGASWYRALGTADSPGTKLFTITGHVERQGVFEAPFGITLRQAIEQFAGGMLGGAPFKLALTGGAAGTIVGHKSLHVPLDFQSARHGVALGAGAILVADESLSVPTLLGWLLHFFEMESCGKCTPCREGTTMTRELVERMTAGRAGAGDVTELRRLARVLRLTSFCGLGQSVAWPIESALANFPAEFPEVATG